MDHAEEYVTLDDSIQELKRGCLNSEFQFLDKAPLEVGVVDEGGIEFPDFIYQNHIPLISDRFKAVLDKLQIDNLFYKKIYITCEITGAREIYWLALPPRINCLNYDKSIVNEVLGYAEEIVIDGNNVGNYHIFKLQGVSNQEIYITKDLKEILEKQNLEGVVFYSY